MINQPSFWSQSLSHAILSCLLRRPDDKLDRSTVKNLIGRSQSIKVSVPKGEGGGGNTEVRRAISFRQRADAPLSPVSLQKAAEFRQSSVDEPEAQPPQSPEPAGEVLSEEEEEEEEDAPQLPHAPPPLAVAAAQGSGDTGRPTSPTYAKKGVLSPPVSPTQKRFEQMSPVSVPECVHVTGSLVNELCVVRAW